MTHPDTFGARSTLTVGGTGHEIFRLDALQSRYDVARLPYTLRILLENVLRREDGDTVTRRRRGRRHAGTHAPSRRARSPSRRRASCSRTSPASLPSSTSPRCATRWPSSAATRA